MTKEQFLKLNREIGQCMPDIDIQKEYLENQFTKMGTSIQNGYKSVQYYYNELLKIKEGSNSIFKGTVVVNEKTFGIVENGASYFKMLIDTFERRKLIFNIDPQQEMEKKIVEEIQNNFDSVNIEVVYAHFKAGLVNKRYLTDQELIKFLKTAFEQRKSPERRFKITNAPTKQKIIHIFYNYYKEVASKPHGKQRQYSALLGDYFEGYTTENVRTNFSK